MKRLLLPFSLLILSACTVDTTGLSEESARGPHPSSNANAAVTITEFGDLECPACAAAHIGLITPLLQQEGQRISYEFKHFPLRSIHRYALEASMAAECAADQGKFWEYSDLVFTEQSSLSADGEEALQAWAAELGLDTELFNRCLASDIKRDTVLADYDEGRDMGVTGTPTFFVNGQRVETDLDAMREAIDAQLAQFQQAL